MQYCLIQTGCPDTGEVQRVNCAFCTFPLAEFALLPSGSSEKSVSEENRVSVSLVDKSRYYNDISYQPQP